MSPSTRHWGLDHGAWSVLVQVFPDADVPVVQLRIDATQPPAWHYALGRALRPLRDEGVLIVGSGNLVHNLMQYAWSEPERPAYDWAARFEAQARALIAAGDHEPLIGYERLGTGRPAQHSDPGALPAAAVRAGRAGGGRARCRFPWRASTVARSRCWRSGWGCRSGFSRDPMIRNSLPPVVAPDANLLILGSMPGVRSLEAQQYYAQPRNAFWPIMGEMLGAGPEQPYEVRLEILQRNRIALWDVLKSCHRPGSLDATIRAADAVPNDFAQLLSAHPTITHVFFNGVAAAGLFERLVVAKGRGVGAVRFLRDSAEHESSQRADAAREESRGVAGGVPVAVAPLTGSAPVPGP